VAVLYPRIRSINVRLSEDEYLALERFCAANSTRSMSDLVRKAVQSFVTSANQESVLVSSVNEYFAHVRDLEQKLEMFAAELAMLKAGTQPHKIDGTDDSNETSDSSEAAERRPLDDVEGARHSAAAEQPASATGS
jgi:hypothetical protein